MSHETSPAEYVKTWAILLVLLVVSVCGPWLGIKVVTLITAFGIAFVKAYIVATKFMHLNVEKKYITYMFIAMLAFMVVFFAGVSPDVMHSKGSNWEKIENYQPVFK